MALVPPPAVPNGKESAQDVEMEDAAAVELAKLPEILKEHLFVGGRSDVDTEFGTSCRNSPSPMQYAYEPAISTRLVQRHRISTLPRGVSAAIEEQVTYEETDERSNMTRRQIFSRIIHPSTFWDKHEHFRLWVKAMVSSLILILGVVMMILIWRELHGDLRLMLAEETNEGYYSAQYAQRLYDQNFCDVGPPVELVARCKELELMRTKDYTAIPKILGVTRIIRASINSLFRSADWRVLAFIFIPLCLLKVARIC